ncbi:hypothetical protein V8G54_001935 [Vigna mungo]|uniref:Uncharacterized protein n=1 Tax=Vigna mungo TaxID=3915 RepID=A0AAQ3P978_VIGMU
MKLHFPSSEALISLPYIKSQSLHKLLLTKVTFEREVDATITDAARVRSEKRQAEAAQKVVESRAQQLTAKSVIILYFYSSQHFTSLEWFWSVICEANRFLFPLTEVFELHMEELRARQEEIEKRDETKP